MKNTTPSEILANKSFATQREKDILDCLELLESGWNKNVHIDEKMCIEYYSLLKKAFVELNYAMLLILTINERDKDYDSWLLNINDFRHNNISSIDRMFLDQYFDVLNGEKWNYSSFQLTGSQDCKKYKGSLYACKHTNFLTIRDAYLNCIENLEIPQFISILKTVLMVYIISNGLWEKPINDNNPKVSIV